MRAAIVIVLAAGALYPLAFAPLALYPLLFLSLAVLVAMCQHRPPGQAAKLGFAYGFAAFLTGIYWITISVHTFGGAPLFLAVFLMLALVAFMAGYFALSCYLWRRIAVVSRVPGWLILPAVFISLEWVRGWFLSGFGWLSPGYPLIDSPLRGVFPVLGVFGAGWLVVLGATALASIVVRKRRRFSALLVFIIGAGLAFALGLPDWVKKDGKAITASLVQGAVPQDLKWQPEQLQPTMQLYYDLSSVHFDNDLVIWPEAAIPRSRHALEGLWNQLEKITQSTGTQFVVGTVEYDAKSDKRYNSITVFESETMGQPGKRQVYRKQHLVPFGEFFPVPEFVRERMRMMNLPSQDFTAGTDTQALLELAGKQVAASICYEDVFGHEMRARVAESSLLINVSNDAWFGGSLAPHQHLQIARVRAAELGRMLLRGTNNGISALIDIDGSVLDQSPQFEPYVLNVTAEGAGGVTPYTRFGDWPVVAINLGLCLLGLGWRRKLS